MGPLPVDRFGIFGIVLMSVRIVLGLVWDDSSDSLAFLGFGRDGFGIILGSLWDHFRVGLGWFWGKFGIIWGPVWDHFGIGLVSFWGRFGITMRSFWHHFGSLKK